MTTLAITNSLATQSTVDDQVIRMWLHNRSSHTRRAYAGDVAKLRAFCQCPLALTTLGQLQDFSDSLATAPASKHRTLSAAKSLFKFAHGLGYIPFNTAHALIVEKISARVKPSRMLTEAQVKSIIDSETNTRNRTILRLLYASGVRVTELCNLRWSDCLSRGEIGQITVTGKGNKIREILLPSSIWSELQALPRFGELVIGLSECSIWRIVRAAAERASVELGVSPHWLRHSCASHALDNGAPLSTVQKTLGHASVRTTELYLHARPNESAGMWLKV